MGCILCPQSQGDKNILLDAIKVGDVDEISRYFSKHPSYINEKVGSNGESLLGVSCQWGRAEITHHLINLPGIDLEHRCVMGTTPFYNACYANEVACAKLLLDAGADIEVRTDGGWHPLACAAWLGYEDIVQLLLTTSRVNVNNPVDDGQTPLMISCEYGFSNIAELLLLSNADVHLQQEGGQSALHIAAFHGQTDVLQVLLRHGARIDLKDDGDFTALCRCGELSSNFDCFKLLRLHGADILDAGWNGNTCLHIAGSHGNTALLESIITEANDDFCVSQAMLARNAFGYTASQLALVGGFSSLAWSMNCFSGSPSNEVPQKINPVTFVENAKQLLPNTSLEYVLLMSVESFEREGKMLHYSEVIRKGLHVVLQKDLLHHSNLHILFISHRWGADEVPDPTNEQFEIAINFLHQSEAGQSVTHVWCDYSSICQDKSSIEFKNHLANIPTAIACATTVLIIPKVVKVEALHTATYIPITALNDYLSRAWCTLEWMAALLSGSQVYVAFKFGDVTVFQKFPRAEGAGASLGFTQAYLDSFNPLLESGRVYVIGVNRCYSHWQCKESCQILTALHKLCTEFERESKQQLLSQISQMNATDDDISQDTNLTLMYSLLGVTFDPDDKLRVFNILLFVGLCFFRINKL